MADRPPEILIIYTSKKGRTAQMVEPIRAAIEAEGVTAQVRTVEEVTLEEMKAADGIVIGNPTRYAGIDWQIKRLFDVVVHQEYPVALEGKVGGAFTAGAKPGSGAEIALMATIHMLLSHGLIVRGNARGAHFGPVSFNESPPEEIENRCRDWGRLWAGLVKAVSAQRPVPVGSRQ